MSMLERGIRISTAIKKLSKTSKRDVNEIRVIVYLSSRTRPIQACGELRKYAER